MAIVCFSTVLLFATLWPIPSKLVPSLLHVSSCIFGEVVIVNPWTPHNSFSALIGIIIIHLIHSLGVYIF